MKTGETEEKVREFIVAGPFDVEFEQGKGGRSILQTNGESFFKEHPQYAEEVGCYVFAVRAGKGYTPIYVGMTAKAFNQEVFATSKLLKYTEGSQQIGKGTPVMFLISTKSKQRGAPKKAIHDVEKELIQLAANKNSNLLNVQNKPQQPQWRIHGVINGTQGAPTKEEKEFKAMLGL